LGPRSRSLVLPVKFMDDTSSDEAKQHPSLPASKHPMKLLSLCVYRVLLAPRRDMSIKEKNVDIYIRLTSPSFSSSRVKLLNGFLFIVKV